MLQKLKQELALCVIHGSVSIENNIQLNKIGVELSKSTIKVIQKISFQILELINNKSSNILGVISLIDAITIVLQSDKELNILKEISMEELNIKYENIRRVEFNFIQSLPIGELADFPLVQNPFLYQLVRNKFHHIVRYEMYKNTEEQNLMLDKIILLFEPNKQLELEKIREMLMNGIYPYVAKNNYTLYYKMLSYYTSKEEADKDFIVIMKQTWDKKHSIYCALSVAKAMDRTDYPQLETVLKYIANTGPNILENLPFIYQVNSYIMGTYGDLDLVKIFVKLFKYMNDLWQGLVLSVLIQTSYRSSIYIQEFLADTAINLVEIIHSNIYIIDIPTYLKRGEDNYIIDENVKNDLLNFVKSVDNANKYTEENNV